MGCSRLILSGWAEEDEGLETELAPSAPRLTPLILAFPQPEENPSYLTKGLSFYGLRSHATLQANGYYNDNIFEAPHDLTGDYIWRISPGVEVSNLQPQDDATVMNAFSLRYTPTVIQFIDGKSSDEVEHLGTISYQHHFTQAVFHAEQQGQHLTGVTDEGGGFLKRNIFQTTVGLDYNFSDKTLWENNFHQIIEDYESSVSSSQWELNTALLYEVAPKLQIGPAVAVGFVDVEDSPDQTFESLQAKVVYHSTEKLSFTGLAGVDFRQFSGRNPAREAGVFNLSATYSPFVSTTFNLQGYRNIQNSSILADQNYTSTGVTVGWNQRFLQDYYGGLTGGYENRDYSGTTTGTAAQRQDDFCFARASVGMAITYWWNLELYYYYRTRDSSQELFEYDNQQIGFNSTMAF